MILVRTQPPALANPIHQIPLAAPKPEGATHPRFATVTHGNLSGGS